MDVPRTLLKAIHRQADAARLLAQIALNIQYSQAKLNYADIEFIDAELTKFVQELERINLYVMADQL